MDLATLGLRLDANQLVGGSEQAKRALTGVTQTASTTEKAMMTLQKVVIGLGLSFGAVKAAQFARETVLLGARYQTLGTVMNILGRNVNRTSGEMAALQKALQQTGISAIQARNNIARMVNANLDLEHATKLARIAQDAAVIANMNSSEAFEQLVYGISTGMVRVLRTMGIFVNFEQAYKKFADSVGKSTEQLSEQERIQARVNAVMESATNIAGAYGSAMETAGKQIKSAERYLEDARVALSQAFQPAFTKAVFAYADALKWVGRNAENIIDAIKTLGIMLGGAAAAFVLVQTKAYLASLAVIAFGRSASTATILTQTLKATLLALASNPVLVGLAALAVSFKLIYDAIKRAREETARLAEDAQTLSDAARVAQAAAYRRQKTAEFAGQGMTQDAAARAAIAYMREHNLYTDIIGHAPVAGGTESDLTKELEKQLNNLRQQRDEAKLLLDLREADEAVLAKARIDLELMADLAQARVDFSGKELARAETLLRQTADYKKQLIDINDAKERAVALADAEQRMVAEYLAQQEWLRRQREEPRLLARDLKEQVEFQRQQNEATKQGTEALRRFNAVAAVHAKYREVIAQYPLISAQDLADILQATYDLAYNLGLPAQSFSDTMKTAIKDTQRAFADFFKNVLTDGIQSFTQLADAIGQVFIDTFSNLIAQRLTDQLAKAVSTAAGAITPLGGIGIGVGILGFLGSMFGASRTIEAATAALEKFDRTLQSLQLDAFQGVAADFKRSLLRIGDSIRQLKDELDAWLAIQPGGPNTWARTKAEYDRRLAEINALGETLVKQALEDWLRTLRELGEDYRVRRLRAFGLEREADALEFALQQQREYEQAVRDGVDAVTLAALAEAQRAEAIRYELNLATQQVTAAQAAVDKTKALIATLRDYSRSITQGTPFQQVGAARTEFERVAALALGGDREAAAKLPQLAQSLLELSRGYYASGQGYAAEVARVQSVLDSVAGQYEAQLSLEERALAVATEQRDTLQAILDALRSNDQTSIVPWDDWAYVSRQTNTILETGFAELAETFTRMADADATRQLATLLQGADTATLSTPAYAVESSSTSRPLDVYGDETSIPRQGLDLALAQRETLAGMLEELKQATTEQQQIGTTLQVGFTDLSRRVTTLTEAVQNGTSTTKRALEAFAL